MFAQQVVGLRLDAIEYVMGGAYVPASSGSMGGYGQPAGLLSEVWAAKEQQRASPAQSQQRKCARLGDDGQIHRQGRAKSGLFGLIGSGVEVGKINRDERGLGPRKVVEHPASVAKAVH